MQFPNQHLGHHIAPIEGAEASLDASLVAVARRLDEKRHPMNREGSHDTSHD